MVRSDAEILWFFALLSSKCKSLDLSHFVIPAFLLLLSCLILNLFFWVHPGGPAWGRSRLKKPSPSSSAAIPGPKGFPIIGSLNLMTGLAHHKLAAAAESCRARRLMAFSLGETRAVVTCNADVAREILKSSSFADRPVIESAYSLMFNRSIGFSPYGVYWKTLRKIAAAHLFSPKQIADAEHQRGEIAYQMESIFASRKQLEPVRVRDLLKLASLNNMMGSVFGRRYDLKSVNSETEELRYLVDEGYDLLGAVNWSDHLPFLAEFDVQKIRSRCAKLVPRVNRFVGGIIAAHREEGGGGMKRDFVDVLLSLDGTDRLSDGDMIAVLWEMIFRGTDTVAVLIEWILARLVLHQDVQSKVHDELDKVVGSGGSRRVTEADLAELVYLSAVVKEVLRLHPPGPLMAWSRLSNKDSTVDGFEVPAGTTTIVNMWAIMRDPRVWSNPLKFEPERFMGQTPDVELGSDPRLAPFGLGRRSCPGKALGLTTVKFWLATLLNAFRFVPCDLGVDLSEVLRLSCEMSTPLEVLVQCRC